MSIYQWCYMFVMSPITNGVGILYLCIWWVAPWQLQKIYKRKIMWSEHCMGPNSGTRPRLTMNCSWRTWFINENLLEYEQEREIKRYLIRFWTWKITSLKLESKWFSKLFPWCVQANIEIPKSIMKQVKSALN